MLRKFVVALAGVLAVCASAQAQSVTNAVPHPVPATSVQSVIVTNGSASPVPTTVSALPPVTIANGTGNAVPTTITNTFMNPVPITGSIGLSGAPAVTISGIPQVFVGNQPPTGSPFATNLQVFGNQPGDVVGSPGTQVPDGKRRTWTTLSATMFCPIGKTALGSIGWQGGSFYLPLQAVYTSVIDNWSVSTVTLQVNLITLQGDQFYAGIHSDGSGCELSVSLWGLETPAQPF